MSSPMKRRIKRTVNALINAKINQSWIGGVDPKDHKAINANATVCKANYNVLVDDISTRLELAINELNSIVEWTQTEKKALRQVELESIARTLARLKA